MNQFSTSVMNSAASSEESPENALGMREFAISESTEEFELVSLMLLWPYACLLERPQVQMVVGLHSGTLVTREREGVDGVDDDAECG